MKTSAAVSLCGLGLTVVLGSTILQGVKRVGEQPDGTTLVTTGQTIRPAGQLTTVDTRPVDAVANSSGTRLFVKDNKGFLVIDMAARTVLQSITVAGGTSLTGMIFGLDGSVWISDAASSIHRYRLNGTNYEFVEKISLPAPEVGGAAYPCGIAESPSGAKLYVAASRSNTLVCIDLTTKQVEWSAPVDVCPYDVAVTPDGMHAWVSCWGGPKPSPGDKVQSSSGTPVKVDQRGVAAQATVVQVSLSTRQVTGRINTGLMPSALEIDWPRKQLYVANANADTVLGIDIEKKRIDSTINTKPDTKLAFGSQPNALALAPDGSRLYVANGGTNSVAVIELGGKPSTIGHIPAGWYPTALVARNDAIWIASAKGLGSRKPFAPGRYGVYGFRGTVQSVPIPSSKELGPMTQTVLADALVPQALRAMERGSRPGIKPVPVPAKPGEPSTIEHVVYILKENRTYDQIFGDLPQADGNASLCVFPRNITPNHHKLAESFVLLDNYYCNGVLSADGHAWAMEGNSTSYFERAFGGWTRSYPFGDDPLAVSTTGFLWDHVLGAGLSFRNYGEFDYASPNPNRSWSQLFQLWQSGQWSQAAFDQNIGVERLRGYSHAGFPGWNMGIPDQIRAEHFLADLAQMSSFPNLTIIYLPQDHTSGTSSGAPTPRACLADNDLALGRIVDALSKTPFWKKMAIFVNEDDPQDGFDHVDGHRSICLVISPFAKRGQVIKSFYNQTSVLHTMCRMLGIRPINAMVAMAPLMTDCFQTTPNPLPYDHLPNQIPLNEMNGGGNDESIELDRLNASIDFSGPDRAHEDDLNRIIWHSAKGKERYPREYAGAHGRGLSARGLALAQFGEDD